MSRRPKLIATDLDGTVVHHDGTISDRTVAAFRKAHSLGIEIFFVTGRPARWMPEIRDAFGIGHAICANGGLLYDLHNDKVLEEWLIAEDSLREAITNLRLVMPTISFAIEAHSYYHREKSYIPRWDVGMDNKGVEKIEDAISGPALKLLARLSGQELSSDAMLALAEPVLKGIVTVTHSNPHDSLLEISAMGVSKGETLAKVAARFGISAEDCVSFGDNPNDFSMFTWCGRSYAMEDGHKDGPKYAKSIAPSHDVDGVAMIIEELLELPA